MKILVVCQHYWPEPFNTTDVCEELVKRGHDVTILTGLPNTGLPNNDIPEKYKHDKSLWIEEHNGVKILRARLHPRKYGATNRILYYLSFWHSANKYAKSMTEKFDIVLGFQFSPVMQVDPGIKYAEKNNVPFLLYSFDLWPESLVVGGIKKGSLPFKWMTKVSKRIYSSADCLLVTSPGFFDYFRNVLGVNPKKKVYLPQYSEDLFGMKPDISQLNDSDFPENETHLMFAGNVGAAQSVETIVQAAALMCDEKIKFHIVGSGSALDLCRALAESLQLDNVVFHGRHNLDEMPAFYSKADAMLATLSDTSLIGCTLPRKIQSYLAASKPILATLSGEGARVISEAQCGFCCEPENPRALAKICCQFACLDADKRSEFAANARSYYEKNYSKERFFEVLENELESLKGTEHVN